jgi:hypothetical protein
MLPGSPQTKSFIILFGIALAGCVLSLCISNIFLGSRAHNYPYTLTQYKQAPETTNTNTQETPVPPVDTSTWKTYQNSDFNFSFLYSPTWTVKKDAKPIVNDFVSYTIDPGKKYDNFKIFISKTGYYAMAGLPTIPVTIGGASGVNSGNVLYGVHAGEMYFTLDLGASLSLTPEFNAWVKSFKFQ